MSLPHSETEAHAGEPATPLAASHSRQGTAQPAPLSRSRSAERALGTSPPALQNAFDSFREPVPADHRESRGAERRMVYLCRDYAVEVSVGGRREPGVVHGELMTRCGRSVADVAAFLLAGERIAGYDCTGELGEFRLETPPEADLRLCLLLDGERCIDLPIEG